MIELTEEQQHALEREKAPLEVVNPRTQEVFALIRRDLYELVRRIVDGPNRRGWDDPALDVSEKYRKKPSTAKTSFWWTGPTAT
jgi:hypothetical protein